MVNHASSPLFVPRPLADTAGRFWGADGEAWLAGLPARVAALAERWGLRIGRAFSPSGITSFVAPGQREDGSSAVLKIAVPPGQTWMEAAALRAYDGNGAVQLLEVDVDAHALLLERCEPGTRLRATGDPDEAIAAGLDVLGRLHRPAPPGAPFASLELVAGQWADQVEQRAAHFHHPLPSTLVTAAVEILRTSPATAGRNVVLHHDLHAGNILAAGRARWLAIDPAPLVGDPAFDTTQLLLEPGDLLRRRDADVGLLHRLDWFAEALALDGTRIVDWALARCVERAFRHLHLRERDDAERAYAQVALVASVR